MTTKEQERKALAQIRAIVDSLGEGSYIATAFEGCFEDAEENITNDFAVSMKDRYQHAMSEAEECRKQYVALCEEYRAERVRLEKALDEERKNVANALEEIEDREELLKRERESRDIALKGLDAAQATLEDARHDLAEANGTIHAMADEIIRLKAKLYDMMTK